MVNMEISCVTSGHFQVKEIRYSTKKCLICKKRCLFRIRKMVKCIECKCIIHKRCLVAAWSELQDNVNKLTITNGRWDGEVIQEIETEPMEKLKAADEPFEKIRGGDTQPVVAFPVLSSAPVMKAQKPTKPYRSAVASGHLPLLQLRLMVIVSRVFGPAPVQIQLRRNLFMAIVSRLRLAQLQAAVSPSIKLPSSALKTITTFAETNYKGTDEILGNGVQLVIAFSSSTKPVIKAQNSLTELFRAAVASGHLPLLRLRLMDTVSRVFGPAPVQIQLRRDLVMAFVSRLRLVQLAAVTQPVMPYIKLSLTAHKTITTLAETTYKATDEILGNRVQLVITISTSTSPVIKAQNPQTEPFRTAVASGHLPLLRLRLMDTVSRVFGPAPVQIQLIRDLFMAFVSRLRLIQLTAVAAPVMPSIKSPSPSLETITAFDCLKLVWSSLSSEKKEFQANAQRLKIAPAPLFVKSKLTVLDYSEMSEPWSYKKNRNKEWIRKVHSITYTNSQFHSFEDIDE